MKWAKYQHIVRLGDSDCEGILNGTVYVFSKVDGTNTGISLDDNGEIRVNSRNRVLTLEQDNQGCMAYVLSQPKFEQYLKKHPNHYLYGEFLIKNSIKDYEDDAWHKVYIFDVVEQIDEEHYRYLSYEEYVPLLEEFGIEYIPLIVKLDHPTEEQVKEYEDKCTFLMKDSKPGEGIVVKSFDYTNPYGHIVWAKVVRSAFKIAHKTKITVDTDSIEERIINDLFTSEFIEKEYNKILNEDGGWTSKSIPKFLGIIWHTFIIEESFNMIKKYKEPKIDFRLLHKFAIEKVKEIKSDLF